jgi:hypothetical protein
VKIFAGFGKIKNIFKEGPFIFADIEVKNSSIIRTQVSSDSYETDDVVKIYKDNKGKIFVEIDPYYKEQYRGTIKHLFLCDFSGENVAFSFGSDSAFILNESGNDVETIGHNSISDGSQVFAGKDVAYLGSHLKNYIATTKDRGISKQEQISELKGNRLFCSSLETKLTYEFSISSVSDEGTIQDIENVRSFEEVNLNDDFHKTLGHFGLSVLSLSKITKIKGEGIGCFAKLLEVTDLVFDETTVIFDGLTNSLLNIDINPSEVNEFEMSLIEHDEAETIMIGNSFKNVRNTKIRFSGVDYKVNYLKLITTEKTVEISLYKMNMTANVENYSFYSFVGYDHIAFNQTFEIDNPIKITSNKVFIDMNGGLDFSSNSTKIVSNELISMSVDEHKIYIDKQGTKATQ